MAVGEETTSAGGRERARHPPYWRITSFIRYFFISMSKLRKLVFLPSNGLFATLESVSEQTIQSFNDPFVHFVHSACSVAKLEFVSLYLRSTYIKI